MRYVLACLAALLLAGCYESSEMLLDASQARQPIKAGQDWKYGNGDRVYHARLTPRPDGWYDFAEARVDGDGTDGSWEQRTALLNFLKNQRGADIFIVGTWDEGEGTYLYGLVVVQPNGAWQSVVPNCDRFTASGGWHDSDLAAAQKAFASQTARGFGCFFRNAASLKRAMNHVVSAPGFWERVAGKSL